MTVDDEGAEEMIAALVMRNRALKNGLREMLDVITGNAELWPNMVRTSILDRVAELRRLT